MFLIRNSYGRHKAIRIPVEADTKSPSLLLPHERIVLNFEEKALQERSESEDGKIAQCRYDNQENDEQKTEGKGVGWQCSDGARCNFLPCEKTGKNKCWNGHAKPPYHHGNCRRDVVESCIGAEAAEILPIVSERRGKTKENL